MADDAATNPWGLTPAEARTLDKIIEYGGHKAAARALGITIWTINTHTKSARDKMGCQGVFAYLVKWGVWRDREARTKAEQQQKELSHEPL